MVPTICTGCGSSIEVAARFCRQCGRPSPLETATREFDQTRTPFPTTPVGQVSTSPELINLPAPVGEASADQIVSSQRRTIIVLASLVGVLLIALVLGLLAYAFLRAPDSAPVGRPGIAGPPPPPSPPAPPDAPVGIGRPRAPAARDGIPDELIFPGSKTVLDAIDSDKWVRQLSTLEPMSEVEDWYSEKVVDAKRIRVPGGVVIFEKDGLKVVLTPTERGTNILLTRER